MDRVEQFIREGALSAHSPWLRVKRNLLVQAVGFAILFGILYLVFWASREGDIQAMSAQVRLVYILVSLVGCLLVFVPRMLQTVIGREARRRLQIWKRWRIDGGTKLATADYARAAKVLREFKKTTYKQAVSDYGQDTVDLLLLANGIFIENGELIRLVSIRSIDEAREAGPGDE